MSMKLVYVIQKIVLFACFAMSLTSCALSNAPKAKSDSWIAANQILSPDQLAPYDLTPENVIADPAPFNHHHFLESWEWLTGPNINPYVVTALGDLIFGNEQGEIILLDVAGGSLITLASSIDALKTELSDNQKLLRVFHPETVSELRNRGIMLAEDEVYSITKPLNLGGTRESENFLAIEMDVHFVILGQIHKGVKGLPEGAEIDRFTIND